MSAENRSAPRRASRRRAWATRFHIRMATSATVAVATPPAMRTVCDPVMSRVANSTIRIDCGTSTAVSTTTNRHRPRWSTLVGALRGRHAAGVAMPIATQPSRRTTSRAEPATTSCTICQRRIRSAAVTASAPATNVRRAGVSADAVNTSRSTNPSTPRSSSTCRTVVVVASAARSVVPQRRFEHQRPRQQRADQHQDRGVESGRDVAISLGRRHQGQGDAQRRLGHEQGEVTRPLATADAVLDPATTAHAATTSATTAAVMATRTGSTEATVRRRHVMGTVDERHDRRHGGNRERGHGEQCARRRPTIGRTRSRARRCRPLPHTSGSVPAYGSFIGREVGR